MKRMTLILFIILIFVSIVYAHNLIPYGFIRPSTSEGPPEPITDHYLSIDDSMHYLYIDGSEHKLLIDGN